MRLCSASQTTATRPPFLEVIVPWLRGAVQPVVVGLFFSLGLEISASALSLDDTPAAFGAGPGCTRQRGIYETDAEMTTPAIFTTFFHLTILQLAPDEGGLITAPLLLEQRAHLR